MQLHGKSMFRNMQDFHLYKYLTWLDGMLREDDSKEYGLT